MSKHEIDFDRKWKASYNAAYALGLITMALGILGMALLVYLILRFFGIF